jgi:hypothetical protein
VDHVFEETQALVLSVRDFAANTPGAQQIGEERHPIVFSGLVGLVLVAAGRTAAII